ncbi:MAG: serine/threonine protein kinase [Deltaproteobacteria bacterium]|nr:serine/threonine protein kinase [Deltaproteobacteria bacterium]
MPDDELGATLPDTPEGTTQSFDLARALAVPPGERYVPIRLLGQGGMGEVMLVADRVIGRDVALKRTRGDRDDGRDQFAREALLQGRLEHPSIVPVYDIARDADGGLFFTMRRVHGKSLADVLAPGVEYSRVRLLQVFNQICLAAHFAHEHGVVHCDIKPANIMLGEYGEVYLLDWGIARTPLEPSTDVSGTVGYMSPEQASGRRSIDRRSDIYALGAILFEILTREPLHPRASIPELLANIAAGIEARASVRAPAIEVPPELEAIWLKAIATQPESRYATARELGDAVERFLEGDRDLALRQRMSRDQAVRASELQARAGESTAARSEALATVGRALALDPTNGQALTTLVELLTTPPPEVPPEALADMQATERKLDRVRSRSGVAALFAWLIGVVVGGIVAGIHDTRAYAFTAATVGIATAAAVFRVRFPPRDGFAPTYVLLAVCLAVAGMGIGFSPWLTTPSLALVFMIATTLSVDERRRRWPIVLVAASLLLPVALEWIGALPASLENRGALLCILPRMTELPDTAFARSFPLVANLACVLMGGLFAVRLRTTLLDLQRRNALQTWQLRQLVPKTVSAATIMPTGPMRAPT